MDLNKVAYYSTWLCLLYLVISVFSIAGQSIVLALMLIVSASYFFINKVGSKSSMISSDLVWLSIPACYLFSLLYSKDFHRGWHQWLNMAPLLVLCFYFFVFERHLKKTHLVYGIVSGAGVSVLFHLFSSFFQFDILIKEGSPMSLFHTAEQNSWIMWSAAILTIFYIRNNVLKITLLVPLVLALLYFGSILFGVVLFVFYLVVNFTLGGSIKSLAVELALWIPVVFIIGYALFPSFYYTLVEYSNHSIKYWNEITFCLNQFLKHPITGVGQGDYIHAMWNEYNAHDLINPAKPLSQFLHLLVSTGMLAIVPIYLIWKKYRSESNSIFILSVFLLIIMVFFAPFTSQVSCSAFIIPLLITRLKATE